MPMPRIGLADSRQTHERLAVHQTVGVERNHEFVIGAPALAEVADIAGLITMIVGAAAIDEARGVILRAPGGEGGFLLPSDLRIICVAEHEPVEEGAGAGALDARADGAEPRDRASRVFVADRHQHGDALGQRRAGARPQARKGAISCRPSRRPCSSQKPSAALQTPSTVQGAATAKATRIAASTTLQPPCDKIHASQRRSAA